LQELRSALTSDHAKRERAGYIEAISLWFQSGLGNNWSVSVSVSVSSPEP